MSTTLTSDRHSRAWRFFPAGLAMAAALAVGMPPVVASGSDLQDPAHAARIWWSGPDPHGGYHCLQQTGGAAGQCEATMGLGPWAIPATDGGYRCLRDTLGASGQCDQAMGLGRPVSSRSDH
jgi:hypothetical protein